MSDHGAGPRASANPEIDITDVFAFPSPERPGRLVAIMDIWSLPPKWVPFSDALDYRIRMRPARIVSTGGRSRFEVGEEERAFSFTFSVATPDGKGGWIQDGICSGPSGKLSVTVADEKGSTAQGLR